MAVTTRDDCLDMLQKLYFAIDRKKRREVEGFYEELQDVVIDHVPEKHPDVDTNLFDASGCDSDD